VDQRFHCKILNFETTTRQNRENTGHIGIGNYFLNRTPVAQQIRERIDKCCCIKPKSFCIAKEIVTRMKR
jgi:hypothetical protein